MSSPALVAAAPVPPSSDTISPRNFRRLAAFIFAHAGIKMPDSKKTLLEGRLRKRLRANNIETFDDYCAFLFDEGGLEGERTHLINAVTTNKTDFFREPGHFCYLEQAVLPEFRARGMRSVRAWSAACSTGPEAYSLAMMLDEQSEARDGISYCILATDLDTEVLAIARKGIYAEDLIEPVPAVYRHRYVRFSRDPGRREVRIAPTLRRAIGFAQLNLMDERYPVGEPMDLIFCRNVLIYFDKETQMKVVSRLADCLAPGGYLFLGHSESIAGHCLPIVQVANTVFKRS